VRRAATVTGTVGGVLATLEGLLLLTLGGLSGLAENDEAGSAIRAGRITLVLGIVVLGGIGLERRNPIVIAAICGGSAAVGFLGYAPLWVFAAAPLAAAAILALLSLRTTATGRSA
jgi:hypothetical protein